MEFTELYKATQDTIKELNLPWTVQRDGNDILVEFDEPAYAPEETYGMGFWLSGNIHSGVRSQVFEQENKDWGFDQNSFIEQMQDYRRGSLVIPDDDTIRADAARINREIDSFCDAMDEKEDEWLKRQKQAADKLGLKIKDAIEPVAKKYHMNLLKYRFGDCIYENPIGTGWRYDIAYEHEGDSRDEVLEFELAVAEFENEDGWQNLIIISGWEGPAYDREYVVKCTVTVPYVK